MIFFTNPVYVFHLTRTDRYIEWDSMFLKSEFFKDVSILIYIVFLSRLKLDRRLQCAEHELQKAVLLGSLCYR